MYIVDTYAYCRVCVCVLSVGVRVCVKYSGKETVRMSYVHIGGKSVYVKYRRACM